jgi:hypothetical protein
MGVCEALNSAAGTREVILRARIVGEPHHGYWLSEGLDGDPCPGWCKRFFTAPSAIAPVFSSFPGAQLTKAQERLNIELIKRLYLLSKPAGYVNSTITINGILVKKFWPFIFRLKDGSYIGNGFDP